MRPSSEPGHVHHHGMEVVRLGEPRGQVTPRVEQIAEMWRAAGFAVQEEDDVERLVWEKLDLQRVLQRHVHRARADDREGARRSPARSGGRRVPSRPTRSRWQAALPSASTILSRTAAAFGERIREARPSMLLDRLAGRPSEIDAINGAIPPRATAHGLSAPANATVTALVNAGEPQDELNLSQT